MAITFTSLRETRDSLNERNDCAVVAVSIATDIDYKIVHAQMRKNGRRSRCGTYSNCTMKTLEDLGAEVKTRFDEAGMTVNRFEKTCDPSKVYLVWIRRHVLAVRGGRVEDWTAGRKHRIRRVSEVKMTTNVLPKTKVKKATKAKHPIKPIVPVFVPQSGWTAALVSLLRDYKHGSVSRNFLRHMSCTPQTMQQLMNASGQKQQYGLVGKLVKEGKLIKSADKKFSLA